MSSCIELRGCWRLRCLSCLDRVRGVTADRFIRDQTGWTIKYINGCTVGTDSLYCCAMVLDDEAHVPADEIDQTDTMDK